MRRRKNKAGRQQLLWGTKLWYVMCTSMLNRCVMCTSLLNRCVVCTSMLNRCVGVMAQ